MSNATPQSRQSGDSQHRRSRGGRNRNNQQHDNRRGGDRESREFRGAHDGRDSRNSGRSEEFRPQAARPPRAAMPVQTSWWQKLLKVVSLGLYQGPKPPTRGERKPEAPRPQADMRAAKSNTRNARTGEGGEGGEKPEGGSAPRGNRGGERSRGGDRATVESPRVYVGNLSYEVTEQDLQELFKGIGGVRNVEIVYNRSTHRSKGYGFVEMLHMDEAMRAVEVLHDQPFMGRKLTVSGAKSKGQDEREEREDRPERAQRPIVVAPRPAPAVTEATTADVPEPMLQTIVETVTQAPAESASHIVQAPVAATRVEAESVTETPPAAEVETPVLAVAEIAVTPAQHAGVTSGAA